MCIFAQPVLSVTSTNIFARLTKEGSQYLAYQMEFQSKELNAMILPLPVALPSAEDSVEFISLENYDDFFVDLNKGFPVIARAKHSAAAGSVDSVVPEEKLKVVEVGAFVASFVPTLADFDRLDDQFVIPKETWDLIPAYADYGFAVFQLKSLEGKPHPMAFKFPSRLENKVFFPTVHIHDGEVHEEEEFDHTLYLQSATFDEVAGEYNGEVVPETGFARSKWTASEFCEIDKSEKLVVRDQLVHRKLMVGSLSNTDVIADLKLEIKKDTESLLQGKSLSIIASATLGLIGLGWFFNRRSRIQRERQRDNNA